MATKESYQKHREKRLLHMRQYYKKNKETIKARQREWYQNNKEKAKIYAKRNAPKYRERKLAQAKERWVRYKNEIYELLGGKICRICGFTDDRALCVDHIYNDGYKERKKEKSISQMRSRVKNTPGRYQILCFNCNQIKKYEKSKENDSFKNKG